VVAANKRTLAKIDAMPTSGSIRKIFGKI